MARRRNYETLAFNVFGAAGKMAIEVSMIGFLGGTCIAFFVVMGDLAPPIIAGYMGVDNSENLRIGVLICVGLVVVLPLSLLRNIDSLVALCTASILFYSLVMVYIMFMSLESLVAGDWWQEATKWRPAGIFQCLPIFTMALSCQAQLFEVYDTLPDPSLGQMVEIVKGAVNLCSGIYIIVGFFGYIGFYSLDLGGNILTAFPDSFGIKLTKMGFALSVAVSFPMVIFPCRTAINSILFARKGGGSANDIAKNYIPQERFVFITTCVVIATLFTAIQIPDIELVLGIVGSTIGTVICILFPVSMFIKLVSANTTEKLVAQAIFVIGVIVLVLGTYVTLYEADTKHAEELKPKMDPFIAPHPVAVNKPDVMNPQIVVPNVVNLNENTPKSSVTKLTENLVAVNDKQEEKKTKENSEARQEPIQPLPPKEDLVNKENIDASLQAKSSAKSTLPDKVEKVEEDIKQKEKDLEKREKQANKLIKELKEQKVEHQQIIKEQKEVLEQLKEHVDAEKAQDTNADGAQQINQVAFKDQNDNNQPVLNAQAMAGQVVGQQIAIQPNQLNTNNQPALAQSQMLQQNAKPIIVQQGNILSNQNDMVHLQQPLVDQQQPIAIVEQQQNQMQQQPNQQILQQAPLARQQQAVLQNQQSNNGFQQAQLQNQNVASLQLNNQHQAYQDERQANGGQGNQIFQESGSINHFDPAAQQQDANGQKLANQVPVGHIQPNVLAQGQKNNYPGQHEPQLPVSSNGQVQQQAPSQQQPHIVQQNVVQLPSFQKQVFNSKDSAQLHQQNEQIINKGGADQLLPGMNQIHGSQFINQPNQMNNQLIPNVHQQQSLISKAEVPNLDIPKSDIKIQNLGQENYQIKQQSPVSENMKSLHENAARKSKLQAKQPDKIDSKREVKYAKAGSTGKVKGIGRDLKEVNIDEFGDVNGTRNKKVIKREIDNVISPSADFAHSNWVQYPSSNNLNVLAVAGAGLGVFKSRQLLSNDDKYD